MDCTSLVAVQVLKGGDSAGRWCFDEEAVRELKYSALSAADRCRCRCSLARTGYTGEDE